MRCTRPLSEHTPPCPNHYSPYDYNVKRLQHQVAYTEPDSHRRESSTGSMHSARSPGAATFDRHSTTEPPGFANVSPNTAAPRPGSGGWPSWGDDSSFQQEINRSPSGGQVGVCVCVLAKPRLISCLKRFNVQVSVFRAFCSECLIALCQCGQDNSSVREHATTP